MLETAGLKAMFLSGTAGIALFLTYIGIREETFWIFSGLLVVDYITGLFKARSIGESITSKRMKYGIASKMSLLIIPIVLGLGAKALDQDASSVLFYGINILILSEVYSILGNVNAIRTGNDLPEIDVISKIAAKIRKFIGG